MQMRDYASMEKVGDLGVHLPTNDEAISVDAGDIILYQGHLLVIYYDANSWDFTRLGKIEGISKQELRTLLGAGVVTVKMELG